MKLDEFQERIIRLNKYLHESGTTHWDGCWKDAHHHACALLKITHQEAALRALGRGDEKEGYCWCRGANPVGVTHDEGCRMAQEALK